MVGGSRYGLGGGMSEVSLLLVVLCNGCVPFETTWTGEAAALWQVLGSWWGGGDRDTLGR